jgi:hypothetical protein
MRLKSNVSIIEALFSTIDDILRCIIFFLLLLLAPLRGSVRFLARLLTTSASQLKIALWSLSSYLRERM